MRNETKVCGLRLQHSRPAFCGTHLCIDASSRFPNVPIRCVIESRSSDTSMTLPGVSLDRNEVLAEHSMGEMMSGAHHGLPQSLT